MRRIVTDADIREGLAALTATCPHLARAHAETGALPPLRKRPKGFEGLARVIVGQQLSIASADAIWGRLSAAVQPFAPAPLLAMPDAALKTAGLSRVKIETLRRLAAAVDSGALDISALGRAKDEAIHARLTSIKGIGPWTRSYVAMRALRDRDAFPASDLGVLHALRRLGAADSPPEAEALSRRWRPYRAHAVMHLWASL